MPSQENPEPAATAATAAVLAATRVEIAAPNRVMPAYLAISTRCRRGTVRNVVWTVRWVHSPAAASVSMATRVPSTVSMSVTEAGGWFSTMEAPTPAAGSTTAAVAISRPDRVDSDLRISRPTNRAVGGRRSARAAAEAGGPAGAGRRARVVADMVCVLPLWLWLWVR